MKLPPCVFFQVCHILCLVGSGKQGTAEISMEASKKYHIMENYPRINVWNINAHHNIKPEKGQKLACPPSRSWS